MERNNFIFYKSFYEAIKDLPDDIQLEIYTAIARYALYGEGIMELSPVANTVFTLIKPLIDANNRKYENGKKGGAPKGSRNNPNGRPKTNRELTEGEQWLDNNKPITNQKQTKNKPYVEEEEEEEDEVEVDNKLTVINNSTAIAKPDFVNFFNSAMKNFNAQIPPIKSLAGERAGFLNARIREYGLDAVKEVIQKAAASNFLNGGGQNGWVADCTWILRPNNFIKILEGSYDNNNQQINNTYDRRQQAKQATLARQNAAIDRIIEEETLRWEQQQLSDGGSIEGIQARQVH